MAAKGSGQEKSVMGSQVLHVVDGRQGSAQHISAQPLDPWCTCVVTGVAMVVPVQCERPTGVILTQSTLRKFWSKVDKAHLDATTVGQANVSSDQ